MVTVLGVNRYRRVTTADPNSATKVLAPLEPVEEGAIYDGLTAEAEADG